jgi:hypothetical protein
LAEFSIVSAALTGFRVMRDKPRAVMVWAMVRLLLTLLIVAAAVTLFGDPITWMAVVALSHSGDFSELGPLLWKVLPFYGVLVIGGLIYGGVIAAAMNRAVLRPDEDEFGYLRLGGDEFRQAGLILLFGVVCVGFACAFALAATILAILTQETHVPRTLAKWIVELPLLAGVAYICLRFSLASAHTFATGKITLFRAWPLTRGRFWRLAGVMALSLIIVGLVTVLASLAIVPLVGPFRATAGVAHDPLAAVLSLATALQLVLDAVVGAVTMPLILTPMTAVYAALFNQAPAKPDVELPDPSGLV